MKRRRLPASVVALLVFIATAAMFPTLDLALSQALFDVGREQFIGTGNPLVEASYRYVPVAGRTLAAMLLVLALAGTRRLAWVPAGIHRRAWAMLIAAILTHGLVVDMALKDGWGRPRPVHLSAFGGWTEYRAPLAPSNLCARNCSFVSGHAAAGFSLMLWGLGGSASRRRISWRIGTAAGMLIGLGRVLQGAHFAFDIVGAWIVVWLCRDLARAAWCLFRWRRRALAGALAS